MVDSSVEKVQNLMLKIKVSTCISDNLRGLYQLKRIQYLKPELDIETRWNSTFYMLQKMQKIEMTLNLLADVLTLLEPIETATKLLSATSYPTKGDIHLVFLSIQDFLDSYIGQEEFSQIIVAASIHQKLEKYWNIIDKFFIVSAVLDLCAKLKIFNRTEVTNVKNIVQEIIKQYKY
ncbi:10170_t:CDS:2 [Cetraspora pellucida]|uniref:10170_t:CDS:1 n=1 Tax=Cetraspora pellucida TaxID=1433469 RepID=A0ACA9LKT2_9GLOM|nr:10170_t:CDS:2 [Cetraspora pellucida]